MNEKLLKGALVRKSTKELSGLNSSKRNFKSTSNSSYLVLPGRRAVFEALKVNPKNVKKVVFLNEQSKQKYAVISKMAELSKVPQSLASQSELKILRKNGVDLIAKREMIPVSLLNKNLITKHSIPNLVVILDRIQDPHNLGAILRSCSCFGVDLVILPKNRSAFITPTVAKVASGALEHVKIALTPGTARALDLLQNVGITIIGLDPHGELSILTKELEDNLGQKVAIVLGQEDKGLSALVKNKCDLLVKIDQVGGVDSLNAGIALAIAVFEIRRIISLKAKNA
jgi:23S rRNA (guanosine2251-2'-O)-methyltransferase